MLESSKSGNQNPAFDPNVRSFFLIQMNSANQRPANENNHVIRKKHVINIQKYHHKRK